MSSLPLIQTAAHIVIWGTNHADKREWKWTRTRCSRENRFMVGLDVGSTTVKAVVLNAATDEILWQDYQRHETKQPEKTLEFLRRIEAEVGVNSHNTRMFVTGSGGGVLAELIGAKFVQEVTAVALAVEKQHPEVYSVIELGGQDAKIIVFKDDNESGRKKKIPSMNDKCAGGTGAVIDKINAKLKIPARGAEQPGLPRHQAAQSGRQVRRLRRDGHQQPAESRHASRSVDGFSVRRDRAAEPERPYSRPYAAAARACFSAVRTPSSAACAKPGRRTSRACGKSAKSKSPPDRSRKN